MNAWVGAVMALEGVAIIVMALGWLVSESDMKAQRDRFAEERQMLVNRVVAKHAGEVVALDRAATPKEPREPAEPVHVVGLS